jgi:hypothetical protein
MLAAKNFLACSKAAPVVVTAADTLAVNSVPEDSTANISNMPVFTADRAKDACCAATDVLSALNVAIP